MWQAGRSWGVIISLLVGVGIYFTGYLLTVEPLRICTRPGVTRPRVALVVLPVYRISILDWDPTGYSHELIRRFFGPAHRIDCWLRPHHWE